MSIIIFVAIGVLAFALLILGTSIYNGLVSLKNQVDRSWANIDVILKQRFDEIPQLVQVLEQYTQYEQATIQKVMNARANYGRARKIDDKIKASNELNLALQGVFAIGEAYPELKSSEHFSHLQTRVSELESQIADRREHFNESATNLNTRIQQIPDVFFANLLGFQRTTLYEVASFEKERPSLQMKIPV